MIGRYFFSAPCPMTSRDEAPDPVDDHLQEVLDAARAARGR